MQSILPRDKPLGGPDDAVGRGDAERIWYARLFFDTTAGTVHHSPSTSLHRMDSASITRCTVRSRSCNVAAMRGPFRFSPDALRILPYARSSVGVCALRWTLYTRAATAPPASGPRR